MEELIIEYIYDTCKLKGCSDVFFDGRKVYYDVLKKHLCDLFVLQEYEVDGYLMHCFYVMDMDFEYVLFMGYLKPKEPEGILFYMDYGVGINRNGRQYVGGIDPINEEPNLGTTLRMYGELNHGHIINPENYGPFVICGDLP